MSNFVDLPAQSTPSISKKKYTKAEDRREDRLAIEKEKRRALFEAVPEKGNLDLEVVHDSTYFFS